MAKVKGKTFNGMKFLLYFWRILVLAHDVGGSLNGTHFFQILMMQMVRTSKAPDVIESSSHHLKHVHLLNPHSLSKKTLELIS